MKAIVAGSYYIYFNEDGYHSLNQLIEELQPTKIGLITDYNTSNFCKTILISKLARGAEIIEFSIPPGEENKNLDSCLTIWNKLTESNFDRKSLLINLGGGVVTDLGGFVASTFLRGISFINLPTSMLAMVDASIGGKTGIDLGVLKNQIGVMASPKMVLIDYIFLKTLPKQQFNSGIAEVLKHGLIHSERFWKKITKNKITVETDELSSIIYKSIQIKNKIVSEDYYETGLRKSLNFGHTLGHAIESYSLSHKEIKSLLHGEAIAIGLALEAYLSSKYLGFPKKYVFEIKLVLKNYFNAIAFSNESIIDIISYLKYDKKNNNEQVNFVLLKDFGEIVLDIQVSEKSIKEAFKFYLE